MSQTEPRSQPDQDAPRRWLSRLEQARFTQLLAGLALLLFVTPFVDTFSNQLGKVIASVVVTVLLSVVLIAAALAVSVDQKHNRTTTLVMAGGCLILTLLTHLSDESALRVAQEILTIGFLIHVVRLIVQSLFQQHQVGFDAIAASMCGYLLIGVAFAIVFSLVMEIDGTALSTNAAGQTTKMTFHFGDQHTAAAMYFSFVTLTTLGYGDITPVSMPARMLTTAEALIGQLYLVVLVARLVGLHISTEMEARQSCAEK
jgi:hypothetical protein